MRTSKLLTTLAIVSVVLIAGCNKEGFERDGLYPGKSKLTTVLPGGASAGVNLGVAGNFVILSKSGITNVPTSAITGDIGVSPIDATAITGFALIMDGSNTFSTSAQVTGKVYAADYTLPTPATMNSAVLNMETAYTDAAGRTATSAATTNVGAGTLTSLTLAPGVYEWGTNVTIPTDLTLNGSATDVWIFNVEGTLDMAANMEVILTGGALPQNIFWRVADVVTLGTTSHFEGIILGKTLIALQTGASINGRLLAQTEVTLDQNTVTVSGSSGGGTVPPKPCRDFVTGGGWIKGNSDASGHKNDKATFGVSGGIKNGKYWGQLSYNDHNGVQVKSTSVTAYTVIDAKTRQIKGIARVNGHGSFTYTVVVVDNGERGRNDSFSLVLSNGYSYSASGTLKGGNIQLHKECGESHDHGDKENYNDKDETHGNNCDNDHGWNNDHDWNNDHGRN